MKTFALRRRLAAGANIRRNPQMPAKRKTRKTKKTKAKKTKAKRRK